MTELNLRATKFFPPKQLFVQPIVNPKAIRYLSQIGVLIKMFFDVGLWQN